MQAYSIFYCLLLPCMLSDVKNECDLAAQKVKFCSPISRNNFGIVQFDEDKSSSKFEYNCISLNESFLSKNKFENSGLQRNSIINVLRRREREIFEVQIYLVVTMLPWSPSYLVTPQQENHFHARKTDTGFLVFCTK